MPNKRRFLNLLLGISCKIKQDVALFLGCFNKTIISLAPILHRVIIANEVRSAEMKWLFITSYPTPALGIIIHCCQGNARDCIMYFIDVLNFLGCEEEHC